MPPQRAAMQREFNLNATSLHLNKDEHPTNGPALKSKKKKLAAAKEELEKRPIFRCRTCDLMRTCVLDSCASSCNLLRLLISYSVIRARFKCRKLCCVSTRHRAACENGVVIWTEPRSPRSRWMLGTKELTKNMKITTPRTDTHFTRRALSLIRCCRGESRK